MNFHSSRKCTWTLYPTGPFVEPLFCCWKLNVTHFSTPRTLQAARNLIQRFLICHRRSQKSTRAHQEKGSRLALNSNHCAHAAAKIKRKRHRQTGNRSNEKFVISRALTFRFLPLFSRHRSCRARLAVIVLISVLHFFVFAFAQHTMAARTIGRTIIHVCERESEPFSTFCHVPQRRLLAFLPDRCLWLIYLCKNSNRCKYCVNCEWFF